MNRSLREYFQKAKLIGNSSNTESSNNYSNKLKNKFIKKQLVFFLNSFQIINSYIIIVGDLFNNIIINNKISMIEMPTIQLSILLLK